MSANPSKRERWPIPPTTRHVWILRKHRWEVPWQGFVVAWRRHSYRWQALVVYVDESVPQKPLVQTWIPRERLLPVRSVPEDLMSDPFAEMRWKRKTG